MKKNDLIKILQKIKGNPTIIIWNGFVSDYQHVKSCEEINLYKMSLESILKLKEFELQRSLKDFNAVLSLEEIEKTKKEYKKEDYEILDCPQEYYTKRKFLIIEPGLRDKKSYDRCGNFIY